MGERSVQAAELVAVSANSGDAADPVPAASVQSVRRALTLLSQFTSKQPQWTVSELSRATNLHKSVVTRNMATMAQLGFVVQDPTTRSYGIGPRAFAVGNAYRPHATLRHVAQPVMQQLTDQFGHATSLGVRSGDQCVYILNNEGSLPIRVVADVGETRDCHANGIGKVLLAGMTDASVRALLGNGPLRRHTPRTITAVDTLLAELDEIRQTRIAYNREEAVIGVGGVAAPIVDGSGACIAGLSIVYPTHLVDADAERTLAQALSAGAATISTLLSQ